MNELGGGIKASCRLILNKRRGCYKLDVVCDSFDPNDWGSITSFEEEESMSEHEPNFIKIQIKGGGSVAHSSLEHKTLKIGLTIELYLKENS